MNTFPVLHVIRIDAASCPSIPKHDTVPQERLVACNYRLLFHEILCILNSLDYIVTQRLLKTNQPPEIVQNK